MYIYIYKYMCGSFISCPPEKKDPLGNGFPLPISPVRENSEVVLTYQYNCSLQ